MKFTKEQEKISLRNWRKTWKLLGLEGSKPYSYALHHKDETLRHTNIERYIEWRPEDLEVLTYSEHCSLHAKKQKHSEETNRKRSNTLKGRHLSEEHKKHLSDAMKNSTPD